MGFALLISDFDLSSITLQHLEDEPFSKSDKKYQNNLERSTVHRKQR
jgi:hypothetical protein